MILRIAPDFCWLTSWDIFLMAEQEDEDIEPKSFETVCHRLIKHGWFYTRPDDFPSPSRGGPRRRLILRNRKPPFDQYPPNLDQPAV